MRKVGLAREQQITRAFSKDYMVFKRSGRFLWKREWTQIRFMDCRTMTSVHTWDY